MRSIFLLIVVTFAGTGIVVAEHSPTAALHPSIASLELLTLSDGAVLDTGIWEQGGHAAPFYVDIDNDGDRDLVVGDYGGKFRIYENVGVDGSPSFAAASSPIKGRQGDARVPIWCCMAAGGRFVDIDGDSVLDLSAGSYAPGAIYWFQGIGAGVFGERHMLLDGAGVPIFTHPTDVYADEHQVSSRATSYASNIAWVDWNDDGTLDLLIGSNSGELFVRLGVTEDNKPTRAEVPIESQPVFRRSHWQQRLNNGLYEIEIDGEPAIPDGHAAPTVADWDGDGLWDILLGSYSGAVYLLQNSGKPGAPLFKTREQILPAGVGLQWLENGESPVLGRRSQIHAIDYNLDGTMDLLIGYWSVSQSPRQDLTEAERLKLNTLLSELRSLDIKAGFDFSEVRAKSAAYGLFRVDESEDKVRLNEKMSNLENRLQSYLKSHEWKLKDYTLRWPIRHHGHVWIALQAKNPK